MTRDHTSQARASAPISWLLLERYALGELDAETRAQVAARLEADAESRACLARIEADQRTLRPLPAELLALARASSGQTAASATKAVAATAKTERPTFATRWRWLFAVGPALAAALLLLVLWPRETSHVTPAHRRAWPARQAIKGGDLALALVRERAGVTTKDPTSFRDGDRFKVLVTAPLGSGLGAELIVLQGGERYLPLPRVPALEGGNRKALTGAFSLDGAGPVDVCLLAARKLPPRSALAHVADRAALGAAGRHVVCIRLQRR